MNVCVTEKPRFKLWEHEALSQVGWERGRGGSWSRVSRASEAGEGLGPGNRGTGPGTFEQV